ncbi:PAS domain-containing protein [Patulibacter sp. NPDC049589]|uniref:PAS domain-containing protein n=1 Tax=Patulibacter sp. NPDC049589 TaxID=3154731 RepID=UPI00343BF1E3
MACPLGASWRACRHRCWDDTTSWGPAGLGPAPHWAPGGSRQDRCIVVEGKLLERHGSTAAETVGRTLREVVPEAAWEVLEPTYRATLRGETITTTIEALDGQGGDETTFVPLRDGARVIGGMAVIRDTTPGRG